MSRRNTLKAKRERRVLREIRHIVNEGRSVGVHGPCHHCGKDAFMSSQRICAACVGRALRALATGTTERPRRPFRWPEVDRRRAA